MGVCDDPDVKHISYASSYFCKMANVVGIYRLSFTQNRVLSRGGPKLNKSTPSNDHDISGRWLCVSHLE